MSFPYLLPQSPPRHSFAWTLGTTGVTEQVHLTNDQLFLLMAHVRESLSILTQSLGILSLLMSLSSLSLPWDYTSHVES